MNIGSCLTETKLRARKLLELFKVGRWNASETVTAYSITTTVAATVRKKKKKKRIG